MQGDSRSMDSTKEALVHSVYDQFTEHHHLCVSYWKQLMHCCSEINPLNSKPQSDIQLALPNIIVQMPTNEKHILQ